MPSRERPEPVSFFAKPSSIHAVDADDQKLDGRQRYLLCFQPEMLFQLGGFWALAILELPSGSLHVNPRGLTIVNHQRLRSLVRNPDGTVTLRLQHNPPGEIPATNWLPVPYAPFVVELLNSRIRPAEAAGTSSPLTLVRMK